MEMYFCPPLLQPPYAFIACVEKVFFLIYFSINSTLDGITHYTVVALRRSWFILPAAVSSGVKMKVVASAAPTKDRTYECVGLHVYLSALN